MNLARDAAQWFTQDIASHEIELAKAIGTFLIGVFEFFIHIIQWLLARL